MKEKKNQIEKKVIKKKKDSYNTYCATAIGLVVSPQASQLWCCILLSLSVIEKFQLVR